MGPPSVHPNRNPTVTNCSHTPKTPPCSWLNSIVLGPSLTQNLICWKIQVYGFCDWNLLAFWSSGWSTSLQLPVLLEALEVMPVNHLWCCYVSLPTGLAPETCSRDFWTPTHGWDTWDTQEGSRSAQCLPKQNPSSHFLPHSRNAAMPLDRLYCLGIKSHPKTNLKSSGMQS